VLQARGVNLLVLHEPTNHLDLPAITQLEQALQGYPGTLIPVTHDRRLLAAVGIDRVIEVAGGSVREGP
jgi:ATPase subunit of ABC transporter with duplicated ATPase domains